MAESRTGDDERVAERECSVTTLQADMRRLTDELHSVKNRNKGVDALISSLSEEREKNNELEKQVRFQETGIRILQSRLSKVGGNCELVLGKREFIRPGTSRKLMEALMTEIHMLKESARYSPVDPMRMEEAIKVNTEQKERLEQLQKKCDESAEQLAKVETLLTATDNEKDSRIAMLRTTIEELEQACKTSNLLCAALTDERRLLKEQIQALRTERDHIKDKVGCNKDEALEARLRRDLLCAKTEIESLKTELAEVNESLANTIEINTHWQTYNRARDRMIERLNRENEHYKSKEVGRGEEEDVVISLQQQRQQLIHENKRLRDQLRVVEEECRDMNVSSDSKKAYETQIEVITNDFQQERKDRERQHAYIIKLEQELENMKSLLRENRCHEVCDEDDDVTQCKELSRTEDRDVQDSSRHGFICPVCSRNFPEDQHMALIDHMESCK